MRKRYRDGKFYGKCVEEYAAEVAGRLGLKDLCEVEFCLGALFYNSTQATTLSTEQRKAAKPLHSCLTQFSMPKVELFFSHLPIRRLFNEFAV